MLSVRLKRGGAKRKPCYRIVVAEKSMRRDGRNVEEIGYYHPCNSQKEPVFVVKADRLKHYLGQGARMTSTVANLVKRQKVLEESKDQGQ